MNLKDDFEWLKNDYTAPELIKVINQCIENYGDDVRFEVESYGGEFDAYSSARFICKYQRPLTTLEEMQLVKYEQIKQNNRRLQYEALKKEFGDST